MLALIGIFGAKFIICSTERIDCATAVRTASAGTAIITCQREYERTQRPTTGAMLADMLQQNGNDVAAAALAYSLLGTDARSDAAQTLGKVALSEGWIDDAARTLEYARGLHRDEHRPAGVAKDDQFLAEAHSKRQQFSEALRILDECIAQAREADNALLEANCHLAAARVLTRVGYFEASHEELDRAAPQLSEARDLATLWFQRGTLEQELERGILHHTHHEQAVVAFERSLEILTRFRPTAQMLSIHLNLVYSLAEFGRTDDAQRHLAEAASLDRDNAYENERTALAARIAYRRGDLTLAWRLNEQVYPAMDTEYDRDELIEVSVMQTRIALAKNDLAVAEQWARLGVNFAEEVRAAETSLELRSWILSSRRESYELLFRVLVRAGRLEEALLALDSWQGRTMLDAMAQPSLRASLDLRSVAEGLETLGHWLPVIPRTQFISTGNSHAVSETLKRMDLLALFLADGEVWCVTASHGQLHVSDLGSMDALRDRFDAFIAVPTSSTIATELGELILRDGSFRSTSDALHVLLDAPFAGLPVVALRREGRPLIAVRPVLRVPRLPEKSCVRSERPSHAVVLADAAGDLPEARREAQRVSRSLNATSALGAAATSDALFAVTSGEVLHVAVHASIEASGGELKLHDRSVSASEIAARKLGPSLVVLPSCVTARSNGAELGSLATAFLSAGSKQVVATLRPVSDAGALELVARFYDAGGVADPVGALARVQATLAESDNEEWPNFAVFGSDICAPRP